MDHTRILLVSLTLLLPGIVTAAEVPETNQTVYGTDLPAIREQVIRTLCTTIAAKRAGSQGSVRQTWLTFEEVVKSGMRLNDANSVVVTLEDICIQLVAISSPVEHLFAEEILAPLNERSYIPIDADCIEGKDAPVDVVLVQFDYPARFWAPDCDLQPSWFSRMVHQCYPNKDLSPRILCASTLRAESDEMRATLFAQRQAWDRRTQQSGRLYVYQALVLDSINDNSLFGWRCERSTYRFFPDESSQEDVTRHQRVRGH